jgi:hypothetical protein
MTDTERRAFIERKLKQVHPALARKVRRLIEDLEAKGHQPTIGSGWRSPGEQLVIFNRGDSTVKFSFHNAVTPKGEACALAVDIVDARHGWDSSKRYWTDLGHYAGVHGLVWGGHWKRFPDVAHVQGLPNSMLSKVRNGYLPPFPEEEEEMKPVKIVKDGKTFKGVLDEEKGETYVLLKAVYPNAAYSWDAGKTRLEVSVK